MIDDFNIFNHRKQIKNNFFYKGKNPCSDVVVIKDNNILLIRRSLTVSTEPGKWALPGGFVNSNSSKRGEHFIYDIEEPLDAVIRELKEETNLDLSEQKKHFYKIGVFQGKNRDPRDNKISYSQSYAYIIKLPHTVNTDNIIGMDDADMVKWFNLDDIYNLNMAFDHMEIIKSGINMLKNKNLYGIQKTTK